MSQRCAVSVFVETGVIANAFDVVSSSFLPSPFSSSSRPSFLTPLVSAFQRFSLLLPVCWWREVRLIRRRSRTLRFLHACSAVQAERKIVVANLRSDPHSPPHSCLLIARAVGISCRLTAPSFSATMPLMTRVVANKSGFAHATSIKGHTNSTSPAQRFWLVAPLCLSEGIHPGADKSAD